MTLDAAADLVKAIKTNNHYQINAWEKDFIKSIENQLSMEVGLSTRQATKLKDIYSQCFREG